MQRSACRNPQFAASTPKRHMTYVNAHTVAQGAK